MGLGRENGQGFLDIYRARRMIMAAARLVRAKTRIFFRYPKLIVLCHYRLNRG
jgi:hypothetical protein